MLSPSRRVLCWKLRSHYQPMRSFSKEPTLLAFILKRSPWDLFLFAMCFLSSGQQRSISKQNSFQTGSNVSFSCGGETHVPSWLQSSEDMEKCSKGTVTQNSCFFLSKPLLVDDPGLVFPPRMNLNPSAFPVILCLRGLHARSTEGIFFTECQALSWVCVQTDFLFCCLSTDA